MAHKRFLLVFIFSLVLLSSIEVISAQSNILLPPTVIGISTNTNIVARRQNVSNNIQIPISLGFILDESDVVDVPRNSEIAISCGDGTVIILPPNGLSTISGCATNNNYERSVFLWGNIEIRSNFRNGIQPEIVYPGYSLLGQAPTYIQWYHPHSCPSAGVIRYSLRIIDSSTFQTVLEVSNIADNRIEIPDGTFIAQGGNHTQYRVILSKSDGQGNDCSDFEDVVSHFCIVNQSLPSFVVQNAPSWAGEGSSDFLQAQLAFQNRFFAEAREILLQLRPSLLPEDFDESFDFTNYLNSSLITTSPAYYILLGDVYHSLQSPILAANSYQIAEQLTEEIGDDVTLASVFLRRAEIVRGLTVNVTDSEISGYYNSAIDIYRNLGYTNEISRVQAYLENTEDREVPILCE